MNERWWINCGSRLITQISAIAILSAKRVTRHKGTKCSKSDSPRGICKQTNFYNRSDRRRRWRWANYHINKWNEAGCCPCNSWNQAPFIVNLQTDDCQREHEAALSVFHFSFNSSRDGWQLVNIYDMSGSLLAELWTSSDRLLMDIPLL